MLDIMDLSEEKFMEMTTSVGEKMSNMGKNRNFEGNFFCQKLENFWFWARLMKRSRKFLTRGRRTRK